MKTHRILLALSVAGVATLVTSCYDPYYTGTSSAVITHETYRPGYVVHTLPRQHRVVTYGGTRYYHHNNVYYRPQGRGYVVVDDPYRSSRSDRHYGPSRSGGVTVIASLPRGYRTVTHDGRRYYRHENNYYERSDRGYVRVDDPYRRTTRTTTRTRY